MSTKDVAAFFDKAPCNIRHSPLPIGTDEYFEQVRLRKSYVEPHLLDFMAPWEYQGKRVLDVGCGIGTTSYWFAIRGAMVTAIDISPESLRLASLQLLPLRPIAIAHFALQDAETLPKALIPYDLIFAWGSLHHMASPARALNTLRYQVRTGAELKVMLYHRRSWKVLGLWLKWGRNWDLFTEAQFGCPVARAYTKGEAKRLIEDGGQWRVESIEVRHIFPYRIQDYREWRYRKAFPWNVCPQFLFKWLERRIGWHLLIKARAI